MQPEDSKSAVVSLSQKLVSVPSITAIDESLRSYSEECLKLLTDVAERSGAAVTRLDFEGGHEKWGYPVSNAYIEWTFGTGAKHLCYMGHLDVVPLGNEKNWSKKAFGAEIENGYLYGRGITDMKGSVAAFMSAITENLEILKDSANLRVGMIVTMDEEWAAVNGSVKVLQWMRDQGKKPDAFIVGEPSSQDTLGTHIKIGRRGSLCGYFQVQGVQGHAAYQENFKNPNRALALAASILHAHKFDDATKDFPGTNFESIATKSGDFNASAVIPGSAELLWNIRFTPQHTPESLEQLVNRLIQNPPAWAQQHPDIDSLKDVRIIANKDTASIPYCSTPQSLTSTVRAAIQETLRIDAKLDGSGGTTDGRFAAKIFPAAEVIEFGLPERGGIVNDIRPDDYTVKGGMHQVDERASVKDLVNLEKIYKRTVIGYGNS